MYWLYDLAIILTFFVSAVLGFFAGMGAFAVMKAVKVFFGPRGEGE